MTSNNDHDRNTLKFDYNICAVVFGTDESILNISLKNGFSFVRRSLIPGKDHLSTVFDTTDIGLRRVYETARIDSQTLDVICIEKHVQVVLGKTAAQEWYDTQMNKDLVSLDDQIRAIRLVCECALRCKLVSFKMRSENVGQGTLGFDAIYPVSESAGTRDILKFHCETSDIPELQKKIEKIAFPISDDILNIAHQYYDLSYHQENFISITLLIVALEMIFLDKDNGKKERLSKRCAVFLHNTREERLSCYREMTDAYNLRSNFVHDGNTAGIKNEVIFFLRECVRGVLTSIDPKLFNKDTFIDDLKRKVEKTDYWKL